MQRRHTFATSECSSLSSSLSNRVHASWWWPTSGTTLSHFLCALFDRQHKLPLTTTEGGDMSGRSLLCRGVGEVLRVCFKWCLCWFRRSDLICCHAILTRGCFWSSCRDGASYSVICWLSFGFWIPRALSESVSLFRVGGCESVILRESGWLCLFVHLQSPLSLQMLCVHEYRGACEFRLQAHK